MIFRTQLEHFRKDIQAILRDSSMGKVRLSVRTDSGGGGGESQGKPNGGTQEFLF